MQRVRLSGKCFSCEQNSANIYTRAPRPSQIDPRRSTSVFVPDRAGVETDTLQSLGLSSLGETQANAKRCSNHDSRDSAVEMVQVRQRQGRGLESTVGCPMVPGPPYIHLYPTAQLPRATVRDPCGRREGASVLESVGRSLCLPRVRRFAGFMQRGTCRSAADGEFDNLNSGSRPGRRKGIRSQSSVRRGTLGKVPYR